MSLETRLVDWTVHHARITQRERYIGLSKIGECPRTLYRMYMSPLTKQESEPEQMMKFYIGYASEDDVVRRLQGLGEYRPGITISMFDGLVRGHTDGSFEGRLVEIKSVALEGWLPNGRLPSKVWWQTQAYLRYTNFEKAYVIYLARETGGLKVFDVAADPEMGQRIHSRVLGLVRAVEERREPRCECGRCS